jgi:hypothetical protein
MTMPGFTAEISLDSASIGYRIIYGDAQLADATRVILQRYCFRRGPLICCCYDGGGPCDCHYIWE